MRQCAKKRRYKMGRKKYSKELRDRIAELREKIEKD